MFQGLRVKYSRVLYRYSKQQRAVIFVRFFLWDNSVCIDAKFQLIVTPRYLVITSGSLVWFEGRNLGSVTGISLVLAQCLKPFLQYPTTLVHLKCKSILANNNCKNTRRYGAVNSTVCTYSGHCLSLSINCFKFIRTLSYHMYQVRKFVIEDVACQLPSSQEVWRKRLELLLLHSGFY